MFDVKILTPEDIARNRFSLQNDLREQIASSLRNGKSLYLILDKMENFANFAAEVADSLGTLLVPLGDVKKQGYLTTPTGEILDATGLRVFFIQRTDQTSVDNPTKFLQRLTVHSLPHTNVLIPDALARRIETVLTIGVE